jgi:hypothetical protein
VFEGNEKVELDKKKFEVGLEWILEELYANFEELKLEILRNLHKKVFKMHGIYAKP